MNAGGRELRLPALRRAARPHRHRRVRVPHVRARPRGEPVTTSRSGNPKTTDSEHEKRTNEPTAKKASAPTEGHGGNPRALTSYSFIARHLRGFPFGSRGTVLGRSRTQLDTTEMNNATPIHVRTLSVRSINSAKCPTVSHLCPTPWWDTKKSVRHTESPESGGRPECPTPKQNYRTYARVGAHASRTIDSVSPGTLGTVSDIGSLIVSISGSAVPPGGGTLSDTTGHSGGVAA